MNPGVNELDLLLAFTSELDEISLLVDLDERPRALGRLIGPALGCHALKVHPAHGRISPA